MRFTTLVAIALWATTQAQAQTPAVRLPWGTWEALPSNDTFWHIPNVRFGKDTRQTRFQGSVFPSPISNPNTVMDPTYGPACIQIPLNSTGSPTPEVPIPNPPTGPAPPGEDCLFLDIYIPKSVNLNQPTTQVVVWIYGGAFIFGSKGGDPGDELGPFYTGQGLIEAIQSLGLKENVIFVAGNYRLGAFGWLAGPTVQGLGLPNAGLSDQLLLLDWVQRYIGQVGGNKNAVSVWGESAGASSIMYHLIAQDKKPLPFKRALLQSPAVEWQWDNATNGEMEYNFNMFANKSQCGSGNSKAKFNCLLNADIGLLTTASRDVYDFYASRYLYPWGPAVDNITYPYLPPVALTSGLSKPLDRLIVSHVFNESGTFTPPHTATTKDYDTYVYEFIPQTYNRKVADAIIEHYPSRQYVNQFDRLAATINNASFTCNTRFLYDRYHKGLKVPVWMMQYSVGSDVFPQYDLARHASDLIPTFWNKELNLTQFLEQNFPQIPKGDVGTAVSVIQAASRQYQAYLASWAVSGQPGNGTNNVAWNVASDDADGYVTNVLDFWQHINRSNNVYVDPQNRASDCAFWAKVARRLQLDTPRTHEIDWTPRRKDVGPEPVLVSQHADSWEL